MGLSVAIASAVVAAAGVGVTAATAGGGSGGGRRRLPPELELVLLRENESAIEDIDKDIEGLRQAETDLNASLDTAQKIVEGAIPDQDALRELNQTTVTLAQSLGKAGIDIAESGFLEDEDRAEIKKLQGLEIADPNLERQIREDRQRLKGRLVAQGLSPDQIDRATQQFDERAEGRRFDRSQQLVERRTGLLGVKEELRRGGFARATGAFDVASGQLERERGATERGVSGLVDIAGGRFSASRATSGDAGRLRSERFARFADLGTFDFSKQTQEGLQSGLFGPGSFFQQTGVAAREQDRFLGEVRKREEAISARGINNAVRRIPNDSLIAGVENTNSAQIQRLREQFPGRIT